MAVINQESIEGGILITGFGQPYIEIKVWFVEDFQGANVSRETPRPERRRGCIEARDAS